MPPVGGRSSLATSPAKQVGKLTLTFCTEPAYRGLEIRPSPRSLSNLSVPWALVLCNLDEAQTRWKTGDRY